MIGTREWWMGRKIASRPCVKADREREREGWPEAPFLLFLAEFQSSNVQFRPFSKRHYPQDHNSIEFRPLLLYTKTSFSSNLSNSLQLLPVRYSIMSQLPALHGSLTRLQIPENSPYHPPLLTEFILFGDLPVELRVKI